MKPRAHYVTDFTPLIPQRDVTDANIELVCYNISTFIIFVCIVSHYLIFYHAKHKITEIFVIITGFVSCSPSPCKNGGLCVSSPRDESHCNCTSKYVGEYCQHLNPCHTALRCQNGGSCRVREGIGGGTPSFTCACPVGFTASLCEIPIENACDSSPCFNGATCNLRSLHEYMCMCSNGFTGDHCERKDHCASSPCRNGAECLSLEDSYKCTCAPGFTGPNCADDIDECERNPCRHGTCRNTHGSYR
ncbi:neurogenic locus Notch protein-like [Monomorium pharaonis]|uniref:neurogenic locus Notch protein-like n=1 Tax=Monomorium pharaonis TaxID=307658 RepID=UPI00102E17E4|nr:neurogenic locus Notch protein-like [Monomorium pharaonis]